MERSFLFVGGSSRAGGNTEALARLAAEQLPAASQHWLCLRDLDCRRFVTSGIATSRCVSHSAPNAYC